MPEEPADPTKVSAGAKATRRRALGRKLIKHSSDFKIATASITDSPDLAYLTTKEKSALEKALKNQSSVADYLDRLGARLEDKK